MDSTNKTTKIKVETLPDYLTIVDFEGNEIDAKTICDNIICLFFSAGWSPPCRKFRPLLFDFYNKLEESNSGLSIIYVPLDNSEEQMTEYLTDHHKSWLRVPYHSKCIKYGVL